MFDRPSINIARIEGGDAFNKVPDTCCMDVDIRFLPNQDPGDILAQIRAIPDMRIVKTFTARPRSSRAATRTCSRCATRVGRSIEGEALSVGRDGASDAVSFLQAGVPAVEFGPIGGGHHGPDEWVSIASLARYRQALGDFVADLPVWLSQASARRWTARASRAGWRDAGPTRHRPSTGSPTRAAGRLLRAPRRRCVIFAADGRGRGDRRCC